MSFWQATYHVYDPVPRLNMLGYTYCVCVRTCMHIVLLHRKQFVVKFILRFTCFYIYPIECPQCVSAHLCRTLLAMITTTLLCWLSTFSTATSQWSQTCLRRQQSLRLAAVGNVQYLFWMCVNMVSTTLPTSPFLSPPTFLVTFLPTFLPLYPHLFSS